MGVSVASLRRVVNNVVGVVCASAMLVSVAPAAAAAESDTFVDVNASTPHAENIAWLADSGISTGWNGPRGKEFRPVLPVVRQDMAAFLYRLAGSPAFDETKAGNPFKDVNKSTPHYKEVLWLASSGISTGWKDGTFRGMDTVKRQDMAAFLHRLANLAKANPPLGKAASFRDVNRSTPHYEDIVWLSRTGVTTGWKDGTFRGMNAVIRQDMAAFLQRMHDNVLVYGAKGSTVIAVYGRAENKGGKPIGNVALKFAGAKAPSVRTDAAGYFTAHLVKGVTYTVTADGLKSRVTANGFSNVKVTNTTGSITLGRTITDGKSSMKTASTAIYIAPGDYTVSSDHRTLTVTNAALPLKTGDNVLFAPKNGFEGRAVAISSISGSGAKRSISGSQAELDRVLESLDIAPEQVAAKNAVITPAKGVTVEDANAAGGRAAIDVDPDPTTLEKTFIIDQALTTKIDDDNIQHAVGDKDKVGYFFSRTTLSLKISEAVHLEFPRLDKSSITFSVDTPADSWQVACMSYTGKAYYQGSPCAETEEADRKYLWNGGDKPQISDANASDPGEERELEPKELGTITYGLPLGASIEVPIELVARVSGHFRATNDMRANLHAQVVLGDGKVTPQFDPPVVNKKVEPQVTAAASASGGIRVSPTLKFVGAELANVEGETGLYFKASGRMSVRNGVILAADSGAKYKLNYYLDAQWSLPVLAIGKNIHVDIPVVGDKINETLQYLARYSDPQYFGGKKRLVDKNILQGPKQQVNGHAVRTVVSDVNTKYAITEDGSLWAWGANDYGQLGDGSDSGHSTPYRVQNLWNVKDVVLDSDCSDMQGSGTVSSCSVAALTSDGSVWVWGSNAHGQVGDGTTAQRRAPVKVMNLPAIASVTVRHGSVFAVANDGSLWAWGANNYGQLGDGTNIDRYAPVKVNGPAAVKSVDTGYDARSVFAVTKSGQLWSWGNNAQGQIGNGDTSYAPTPYRVVGLPAVESVTIAYKVDGVYSVFAIGENGSVWTWGNDDNDRLGTTNGDNRTPGRVAGLPAVKSVDYDGDTIVALATDGGVWAWGGNYYGSLGNGTENTGSPSPVRVNGLPAIKSLDVTSSTVFAVANDGGLWTWGWNRYGIVGNGTNEVRTTPYHVQGGLTKVKSVVIGGSLPAAYAIAGDGTLWAWGSDDAGKLGDGPTRGDRNVPYQVKGVSGVKSVDVDEGASVAAIAGDGSLWTWGVNYDGQLGDGTNGDRPQPVKVEFR